MQWSQATAVKIYVHLCDYYLIAYTSFLQFSLCKVEMTKIMKGSTNSTR